MTPRPLDDAERQVWMMLGARLDWTPRDCWEWQGAVNGRGYGVMRHRGKLVLTHRLALRTHLGRPLRRGKLVLHSCHNRKCCNPEHLSEGTPSRNQLDRWARQRVSTLQE